MLCSERTRCAIMLPLRSFSCRRKLMSASLIRDRIIDLIILIQSAICRYVDGTRLLGQNRSSPDIWLIDLRLFIFVDGGSHFKTTHEVDLKLQCDRDQTANDESKALGFHVLRLSYVDIENFKQEIEDMIELIQEKQNESLSPSFKCSSGYRNACLGEWVWWWRMHSHTEGSLTKAFLTWALEWVHQWWHNSW